MSERRRSITGSLTAASRVRMRVAFMMYMPGPSSGFIDVGNKAVCKARRISFVTRRYLYSNNSCMVSRPLPQVPRSSCARMATTRAATLLRKHLGWRGRTGPGVAVAYHQVDTANQVSAAVQFIQPVFLLT